MAIKGKKGKRDPWERRKFRVRKRIASVVARPRVSVYKSDRYTYAQLISDQTGRTVASASSNEKEVLAEIEAIKAKQQEKSAGKEGKESKASAPRSASSKSVVAAKAVGIVLARRGLAQNVKQVVFDRNGFVYHGRVKAVADGARQGGLDF